MSIFRTKVECAGLCLSVINCHAFEFKELDSNNGCRCILYEEDGVCDGNPSDVNLVEVYVDHSKAFHRCQG